MLAQMGRKAAGNEGQTVLRGRSVMRDQVVQRER